MKVYIIIMLASSVINVVSVTHKTVFWNANTSAILTYKAQFQQPVLK